MHTYNINSHYICADHSNTLVLWDPVWWEPPMGSKPQTTRPTTPRCTSIPSAFSIPTCHTHLHHIWSQENSTLCLFCTCTREADMAEQEKTWAITLQIAFHPCPEPLDPEALQPTTCSPSISHSMSPYARICSPSHPPLAARACHLQSSGCLFLLSHLELPAKFLGSTFLFALMTLSLPLAWYTGTCFCSHFALVESILPGQPWWLFRGVTVQLPILRRLYISPKTKLKFLHCLGILRHLPALPVLTSHLTSLLPQQHILLFPLSVHGFLLSSFLSPFPPPSFSPFQPLLQHHLLWQVSERRPSWETNPNTLSPHSLLFFISKLPLIFLVSHS